ncbi:MAG TPA: histidine kinase [Streptosporangiaceae bacterium]|nr:histidine kinase [Streptosporangiaceae bacterium]
METPRSPRLRRPWSAHPVAVDCASVALIAVAQIAIFRQLAHLRGVSHWEGAVIFAVAVLPAAFRRRLPRTALALVAAGGIGMTVISGTTVLPLAVTFVMYVIPLRFARREALWLLAGALLVTSIPLTASAHFHDHAAGDAGRLLLVNALLITAAWLLGYTVRQQRAYTASLHEQAERRLREQLAEARRARSEERLQIARELHDVVAHSMSLIAVQAGVANYVIGARPQEAERALSSIEQTSRGALREMRALLGVLRADGDGTRQALGGELAPAPGLADLDSLAGRTAEAGVRVELVVSGSRLSLPAGLDLAAYRVIQEAITNVIKHAATDSCLVSVAYQADALTLEITDEGRGADGGDGNGGSGPSGSGHGIAGMRERVAMYGGEFLAVPVPGHGFLVSARFPLASSLA